MNLQSLIDGDELTGVTHVTLEPAWFAWAFAILMGSGIAVVAVKVVPLLVRWSSCGRKDRVGAVAGLLILAGIVAMTARISTTSVMRIELAPDAIIFRYAFHSASIAYSNVKAVETKVIRFRGTRRSGWQTRLTFTVIGRDSTLTLAAPYYDEDLRMQIEALASASTHMNLRV